MTDKEKKELTQVERYQKASRAVRKHTFISMGIGLVPLPLVDLAAVTGDQLLMLGELSKLYQVRFYKNLGKSLISSLVYGLAANSTTGIIASIFKIVPYVGTVLGMTTMSLYSGAATHAIGRVFIRHFESGGTFLDFDPDLIRSDFEKEFKDGEKIVADKHKDDKDSKEEKKAEKKVEKKAEKKTEKKK